MLNPVPQADEEGAGGVAVLPLSVLPASATVLRRPASVWDGVSVWDSR